jgi:hypothetical protein
VCALGEALVITYKSKRAADLEPGDVIHDPPWAKWRRVKRVEGPHGIPPWVTVVFDPIYSAAYDVDQRVEVVV